MQLHFEKCKQQFTRVDKQCLFAVEMTENSPVSHHGDRQFSLQRYGRQLYTILGLKSYVNVWGPSIITVFCISMLKKNFRDPPTYTHILQLKNMTSFNDFIVCLVNLEHDTPVNRVAFFMMMWY